MLEPFDGILESIVEIPEAFDRIPESIVEMPEAFDRTSESIVEISESSVETVESPGGTTIPVTARLYSVTNELELAKNWGV